MLLLAFLDDVLILGKTFEDHLGNLGEALQRFGQYGLKLKAKKCIFFQREVEFLGRLVSGDKLSMTEADTKVVASWPVPTCSKDVERFMGLANYHRNFVKNFSKLAEPLYSVVGKRKFRWEEEQQEAFDTLKTALTTSPVLALPNHNDPLILDCDASDHAIGCELIQVQDGAEKVITYGSYALTKEQRRYCTTRKELLAIVRFCRQFRYYLLGKPFTIRTDHSSLRWLLRFKEPQGQLARWIEELSQYNMVIQYRCAGKHGNADSLSRIPVVGITCDQFVPGVKPTDLPCGGCSYCVRADSQWGAFSREVDDAVQLTSLGDGHRRMHEPLVGDTEQLSLENSAEGVPSRGNSAEGEQSHGNLAGQQYRGISAETVRVGANNHIQIDGKTVYDCGKAYEIVEQPLREENQTETYDWGISRSLSGEERPAVRHTSINTEGEAYLEILSREGTVDVNLFKPVISVCNVNAHNSKPVLSCWGFEAMDVQKLQHEDPNLTFLWDWLENKTEPSEADLFISSPATKFYWLSKEEFTIINGILYHQRPDGSEKDLVMPVGLKKEALRLNHDLPSSGHQGRARTKARMKEKFFWYGMGKDITEYVVTCPICNQSKKSALPGRQPMQEYQAGAPMERVHLDFLGPLPKTPRGNEYVLMMVDQFTKWVECVPLPSQTAEVTAKAAVDGFFSRFGFPFQIFHDQGRNFESKLFTALCEVLDIHKARTTPYRPSANGQVERYNRTLMDAVRCYIKDSQDQWDLHLQQIAGALRSAVNRSTNYTANKLMLGREVNTPAYLMFPQPEVGNDQTTDQYVATLTKNIQSAHEAARSTLKTSLKRMKRNYDLKGIRRHSYKKGDAVYLLDTAVLKGQCRKLCKPWKGPAAVLERLSSALFRVQLRKSMLVVNHDRMKHCRDRNLPGWLRRLRERSDDPKPDTVEDPQLYCLCRKPWQGRFMIQCDRCDEWFHGACVNVTPTEALDIDQYTCPNCGVGQ